MTAPVWVALVMGSIPNESTMRIALTGHRPGPRLDDAHTVVGMSVIMERYPKATIITGGADGADRLWWNVAVQHKMHREAYIPYGYGKHYKLGSCMGVVCASVHPTALLLEPKGGTRHATGIMRKRNVESAYPVLWLNSLTGVVSKVWDTSGFLGETNIGV